MKECKIDLSKTWNEHFTQVPTNRQSYVVFMQMISEEYRLQQFLSSVP